jgi:hypothetical protein
LRRRVIRAPHRAPHRRRIGAAAVVRQMKAGRELPGVIVNRARQPEPVIAQLARAFARQPDKFRNAGQVWRENVPDADADFAGALGGVAAGGGRRAAGGGRWTSAN